MRTPLPFWKAFAESVKAIQLVRHFCSQYQRLPALCNIAKLCSRLRRLVNYQNQTMSETVIMSRLYFYTHNHGVASKRPCLLCLRLVAHKNV